MMAPRIKVKSRPKRLKFVCVELLIFCEMVRVCYVVGGGISADA